MDISPRSLPSLLPILVSVALLGACGDDDPPADAGSEDVSMSDVPGLDAGPPGEDAGEDSGSEDAMAPVDGAADAGGDDAGSDAGDDAGPAAACGPEFSICEDFESATVGGFPAMWDRREGGWGGRSIQVEADQAHSGTQALKIESGRNGAQWLTYTGELGELRNRHFGRMFVRVDQPAPWPAEGLVHGDLFEARGPFGGGTNRVRWGIVKRWLELDTRLLQWIYNVQKDGPEFATGTSYVHPWPDGWFCMEWSFDESEQSAVLWLDGEEITDLTQSRGTNPEVPVFSDISVGWANYQETNEDFVIWIDDVVFDDERVGCER